jgi:PKD repeat protein
MYNGVNIKSMFFTFRRTCLALFIYSLLFIFFISCYKEKDFPVKAEFTIEVQNNDYSVPVKVKITNTTSGAENYQWGFNGASPEASSEYDPGTIEYTQPGIYRIQLRADNQYGGLDSSSIELIIDNAIHTDFTLSNQQSWYPPVTLSINNLTTGAKTYDWSFADGAPAISTLEQPGNVVFNTAGPHLVRLNVGNGKETYTKEITITVLPDIANDFQLTWDAEDNDMEVPFILKTKNNSTSSSFYNWTFSGGTPAASAQTEPSIVYQTAGTYTIALTASNDKKSVTASKTITLLPNSNLFRFQDIKLGISTAQHSIGSYFSSVSGKVFTSGEVNASNGAAIEFAFFGLSSNFSYNRFISPDEVQQYAFAAIPGAIHTKIINKTESCGCGSNMTAAQFDAMADDALLQSTTVNQTTEGLVQFDNGIIPRVVLFETANGRKGAIKIKQFVDAGQQSYLLCDIKIMKEP